MNKPLLFATYQYFDNKGRRLAVYCRYLNSQTAEIWVLPCSKADQFNKAFARKEYEAYLAGTPFTSKPYIYNIDIKPEAGQIKTLLNYCNKHFTKWRAVTITQRIYMDASGNTGHSFNKFSHRKINL